MKLGATAWMAAAGSLLVAGVAMAQSADPVAACAGIAGSKARLRCFDAATARRPAPASPTVSGAGAPVAQGLGAEQVRDTRPQSERPVEQSRVSAHVVSASDNGVGHWRIALDNGSVWQMTEVAAYFTPPRHGEVVRIRKGAIGSYLLDVGTQASVKVARIR